MGLDRHEGVVPMKFPSRTGLVNLGVVSFALSFSIFLGFSCLPWLFCLASLRLILASLLFPKLHYGMLSIHTYIVQM